MDLNEDGIITKQELRRLVEMNGFEVNNAELEALIERYDKDRDGRISFNEFR